MSISQLRRNGRSAIGAGCAIGLLAAAALVAGVQVTRADTQGRRPLFSWSRVSVELPSSQTLFPPGEGAELVNSQCLMCHSAEMVLLQPPLTEEEWRAEVNKMRTVYGSPLPAEQVAAVAGYLARINGPATLEGVRLVPSKSPQAADQVLPPPLHHDTLLETIKTLDAGLFDAYNRCDLDKLAGYIAEDLEFYHDQTGLSRGRQAFLEAIKNNICGKVHRDLLAGSLEAYPLNGYGAVEIGIHTFCDSRQKTACDPNVDGVAKFVMLWRQQADVWKLTRVISYNHLSKR